MRHDELRGRRSAAPSAHPLQVVPHPYPDYIEASSGAPTRHRDALVLWLVSTLPRPLLYGDLMDRSGLTRSQLRMTLWRLRWYGLVQWEPKKRGSLTSLVRVVPIRQGE